MQLRKLLTDDDAVSPVIGVILMVAITVILAAVIASFVLGLGGEQEVAPQHTFDFNFDSDAGGSDNGMLTISSQGGKPIRYDELFVRGSGFCGATATSCSGSISGYDRNTAGNWTQSDTSGATEDTSAVVAGDAMDVAVSDSYEISVVWESLDSSTSAEMASNEGPAS